MSAVDRGRQLVSELVSRGVTISGSGAPDIGAGSGGLSIALAEAGATVTAIEPDPIRYRWAKARIAGHRREIDVTDSTAERLDYAAGAFDLVILDSVIEHVEDPAAVIAEIGRVLSSGGIAYICAPNKFSILNILRDPHYNMLGVVLMPRRLGRFYVERIRRHPRGYWVNKIPTRGWLRRHAATAGMRLELMPLEGVEKLRAPQHISDRFRHVRVLATAANRARMAPLLERLAIQQTPYPRFLAIKEHTA